MYFQILKKDLKRKRTMNMILLIFVTLAAMFIASSANNLFAVSNALDDFLKKANVPDYWFISANYSDVEQFEEFARENGYDYWISELVQINPQNIRIENEKLEYPNTTVFLSTLGKTHVYDKNNKELISVNDGEIYVTNELFQSPDNDFCEGGKIRIRQGGIEKEFTIKGYTKDILFGSKTIGMTRFLVSENDVKLFLDENAAVVSSVGVYTKDAKYQDKFNALGLNLLMTLDRSMIRMMYILDLLIAAVLLVVSVCLILISMVILRFIIHFTIAEEFREIGVMKAIGIPNKTIRGLYIVKYLAISVVGTAIGLGMSFWFSRFMLDSVSQKLIISTGDKYWINIVAAIMVGAVVVLFSYFCTRRIREFSPIDAIRSGTTGERFQKKQIMHLERSHMPTVLFMATNDILSSFKSYFSMIVIFILGTLLVIIPVNTINTLRSDNMITMFSMTRSDHIVSQEIFFHPDTDNYAIIEEQFSKIETMFSENKIAVDVFQEIVFRGNVRKGNQRTNSMAFQGCGTVMTDQYAYIEGTAPQNVCEVALTHLTAEQIGAKIGDDVEIKIGETTKIYTVTAITQSMNNLGEGVRFHQDEKIDYKYAAGAFGIQINYKDHPNEKKLAERKAMLEKLYPNAAVYTSGGYIEYMMGNVAETIDRTKMLILSIVLGINALVAVLMVKSFITKEKGEIALLKAIGFSDNILTVWQALRIGIVLLVSVLIGSFISSPLSALTITPIFRMMGAYSVQYQIHTVEIYVIYPLIILVITVLAAFLSAQGLNRISASEISGHE